MYLKSKDSKYNYTHCHTRTNVYQQCGAFEEAWIWVKVYNITTTCFGCAITMNGWKSRCPLSLRGKANSNITLNYFSV